MQSITGSPFRQSVLQLYLGIPNFLVTAFISVFSVPFTAMHSAHQLITELAFFGILRSLGIFIGAAVATRADRSANCLWHCI